MPIPELDSVFIIIDIGLSDSFWVEPAWKAARSWSSVPLELLLLEVPVVLLVVLEVLFGSAEAWE